MLTIFDLMRLLGTLIGIVVGGGIGLQTLGMIGLIVGVVFGAFVGGYVGSIPLLLAVKGARKKFAAITINELREKLIDDNCRIPNLILLELKARGENIEHDLPFVHSLLTSEETAKRGFGWAALNSAFPEQVATIPGYDPTASVEECREKCQPLLEQLKK